MIRWPKDNQADLIAFYGVPKSAALEAQLTTVIPPFRMTYEGKPVKAITFHRKAAPALLAALNEIWEHYGKDQAKIDALRISVYDGAYNPRYIGKTTKWSNHAFGAAIDLDAAHNAQGTGHGHMPQPVVDAFKRQGFRWGGDYRSATSDPMHFEAVDNGEPTPLTAPPVPPTDQPAPTQPPAPPSPRPQPVRNNGITATIFGGSADPNDSAYTGKPIDDKVLGVALPFHFKGARPRVKVTKGDLSVTCDIVDVGPWNVDDPYWISGDRPQAERGIDKRGRKTNHAGIDLTPAAARAIGIAGKGVVSWEFVT